MIDPQKYEPILWSETLLSVLPGQPPFKGCGVSTAAHGLAMGTGGEFAFMPTGALKGKAARTSDLKRGWKAFLKVADNNGIPDTDDYIRIHRAMAPTGTPDPVRLWTKKRSDIEDALRGDMFISIAVRLSAVAGTDAAKWTTADHQMGIWKLSPKGKTKRIDPMHPHSYNEYHGDWIDLDDVIKAAKAINDGTMLCWTYPRGGWTQEQLLREKKNKQLALVGKTLDKAIADRDAAVQALQDCEDECIPCDEQLAAQRADILDRLHAFEMGLRSD